MAGWDIRLVLFVLFLFVSIAVIVAPFVVKMFLEG